MSRHRRGAQEGPATDAHDMGDASDSPDGRSPQSDDTMEAHDAAGQRRHLIATAAYFRAERRGFAPGWELEDWLAAEIEIEPGPDSPSG